MHYYILFEPHPEKCDLNQEFFFIGLVWAGVTMRWFSNVGAKHGMKKWMACSHFRERKRIQNGAENNQPDNNWSSRWIS